MEGGSVGRLRRAGLGVVAALAAAAVGCSDDGSGPTGDELIGIWGAVSYTYTSAADPAVEVDLIADEGASYSIELVTDGTYRWTLNTLTRSTTGSGRYQVGDGRLTLMPDGGEPTEVYRLSFNQVFLTLTRDDASHDFDGDGTDEPAELRLVLDRF